MTKALLKEKVLEAERLLAIAEEDLTTAMGALEVAPRSNKTMVSEAVQDAFNKLRAARSDVAKLVTLVDQDDEDVT